MKWVDTRADVRHRTLPFLALSNRSASLSIIAGSSGNENVESGAYTRIGKSYILVHFGNIAIFQKSMIFCNLAFCKKLKAAILFSGVLLAVSPTVSAEVRQEKVDVQALAIRSTKPGEKAPVPLPDHGPPEAGETDRLPPRPPVADDPAIRSAIAAELAATEKQPRLGIPLSEFRSIPIERFAQKFTEAKVPDCLHGDALKRQPPVILFVKFEGLYAVPFVVLAKLRGKCN